MIKKIILVALCVINIMTITMFSTQNAKKSTEVSESVTIKAVAVVTGQPETIIRKNIKQYDRYTRGLAHFFLFLTLGVLLYLTLQQFNLKKAFLYAIVICLVYAVFDEIYQEIFSQGRAFQFVDILKDWSGTTSGILATFAIKYMQKRELLREKQRKREHV